MAIYICLHPQHIYCKHISLHPYHPQHIYCKLLLWQYTFVYIYTFHKTYIANCLYGNTQLFTTISSEPHMLQTFYMAIRICLHSYHPQHIYYKLCIWQYTFVYIQIIYKISIANMLYSKILCLHPYQPQLTNFKLL